MGKITIFCFKQDSQKVYYEIYNKNTQCILRRSAGSTGEYVSCKKKNIDSNDAHMYGTWRITMMYVILEAFFYSRMSVFCICYDLKFFLDFFILIFKHFFVLEFLLNKLNSFILSHSNKMTFELECLHFIANIICDWWLLINEMWYVNFIDECDSAVWSVRVFI